MTGPQTKRILLVESHRALQRALATVLDLEPTLEVVGRAESMARAREFITRGEAFDAAVVDLFLPDGDGAELISELQQAYPDALVVVLTSSVDPTDHARAIAAGADGVLSTATPLEDFVSTIKHLG